MNPDTQHSVNLKSENKKSLPPPLVTVVTVVYNGEKFLEEAILSVIGQDYDNIEYIIIDGSSTDGTVEIIKKYEHAIDYWVSERDCGIYDAMNKALCCASRNSWVIFLGADDRFADDRAIQNLFSIQDEKPCDVIFSNVKQINMKAQTISDYYCFLPTGDIEKSYLQFPFHHQGFLFRNDLSNLFDPSLGIHADLDFMLTRYRIGEVRKYHGFVSAYRTGGASDNFSFKNVYSIYKVAKRQNLNVYKIIFYQKVAFFKLILKAALGSLKFRKV